MPTMSKALLKCYKECTRWSVFKMRKVKGDQFWKWEKLKYWVYKHWSVVH